MPRQNTLHEALVNRNIVIVAILIVAAGGLLTWIGLDLPQQGWCKGWLPGWVPELVKELGTAAFGIGILALTWELVARRAFMSEMLATVGLSESIEEQGLLQVSADYLRIPWPEMFKATTTFDAFFSYARTWTNSNSLHLIEMAERRVPMRILLPNPDDARLMAELALWYSTTAAEITARVRGAVTHYAQLSNRPGASVEVRLTAHCPLFTMYLFTQVVVFTTHSHRPAPTPVPTFIAARDKALYSFFRQEFDYLWGQAAPHPLKGAES